MRDQSNLIGQCAAHPGLTRVIASGVITGFARRVISYPILVFCSGASRASIGRPGTLCFGAAGRSAAVCCVRSRGKLHTDSLIGLWAAHPCKEGDTPGINPIVGCSIHRAKLDAYANAELSKFYAWKE